MLPERTGDTMTTLVIMAAGLGSRYGGIKQLEGIDAQDHLIIDYSIHDAIAAGFDKIVFIIRKEIEEEFLSRIFSRVEPLCASLGMTAAYVCQDLHHIPAELPEGRTKPWGTGQAVLEAAGEIDSPFAVINADDYYGKKCFRLIHDWLAGFVLENTLSENGGVTRGVCRVDEDGFLTGITETHDIRRTESGLAAREIEVDVKDTVSMNMWGLQKEFLPLLKKGFEYFFEHLPERDPMKTEYLLPMFINELVEREKASVKVLPTDDSWFGVTFREDHPAVVESFGRLIEAGEYREDLYSDL